MLISTSHTPQAVYRATLHMTRWIALLEFMTFVPALGTLVLVVFAMYLRCGAFGFKIVLTGTCVCYLGMQIGFNFMCVSAFPYNTWAWSVVTAAGDVNLHPCPYITLPSNANRDRWYNPCPRSPLLF